MPDSATDIDASDGFSVAMAPDCENLQILSSQKRLDKASLKCISKHA